MKCFGRTKTSNFRKRCTNGTVFLFCWQHIWQPFTAILTIILFLAAIAQLTGYNLKDILRRKQPIVKPNISCSMEYPIKVEKDKVFRNKRNPEIVVKNNGPIKVVSVSGDLKIYDYNLSKNEITGFVDEGFRSFDHTFFAQELKPFDELRHSTIGLTGKDLLSIYIVKVNYHRESDMEPFTLEEYFFTENGKIIEDSEFKKDERYDRVIEKVKAYQPPKEDALGVKVTAVSDHDWIIEADNWFSAKRGHDGKVRIIGLPIDQGGSKMDGYPFLELQPHPFKATGFYTKAEIVDDHVEVKTAFAVTNTGDSAAMITENGFDIVKTIEPGQTTKYTKTVKVGRMEGNEEPFDNFIKLIDKSEKAFEIEFNIIYRPANDHEKLFKVTGHCFIGKHKVTQIPHSTHVKKP